MRGWLSQLGSAVLRREGRMRKRRKLNVFEMKYLRGMAGVTLRDSIINDAV